MSTPLALGFLEGRLSVHVHFWSLTTGVGHEPKSYCAAFKYDPAVFNTLVLPTAASNMSCLLRVPTLIAIEHFSESHNKEKLLGLLASSLLLKPLNECPPLQPEDLSIPDCITELLDDIKQSLGFPPIPSSPFPTTSELIILPFSLAFRDEYLMLALHEASKYGLHSFQVLAPLILLHPTTTTILEHPAIPNSLN